MSSINSIKGLVNLTLNYDKFSNQLAIFLDKHRDVLIKKKFLTFHLLDMFRQLFLVESIVKDPAQITTVIIGKGIIFDTGGYDIKTNGHMYGMHTDKAGALAAIGAAIDGLSKHTAILTGFAVNELNLFPGTILTSAFGKRVEIQDTDAEGRVLLAGLIEIARNVFPNLKHIITIATLTGSIIQSLGSQYAGLLSTDLELKRALFDKADKLRLYPMPNFPKLKGYTSKRKGVDLTNIDLKNAKLDYAKAFKFLHEFVPKGIHLTHIDMAGVAADDNMNATGYGIEQLRTIDKLLQARG